MDTLTQLEAVHRVLRLLGAHGGRSSNKDDTTEDRMLVETLQALVSISQDWTELAQRCSQLAERLPKMSPELFQSLMESRISPAFPPTTSPSASLPSLTTIEGRAPIVGLSSIERARSTLEDFFRCYLPFHDMQATCPEHVFRHLPLLGFVEAFIYQLDEANEAVLLPPTHAATNSLNGDSPSSPPSTSDVWAPLKAELANRGLLTPRIVSELEDGLRYWSRERSLCLGEGGAELSREVVVEALGWKSFDYRVLHLLLYGLRGVEPEEDHMHFLRLSEILVEISDDLFDYEEDVVRNSFNILRLFCRIYGPDGGPRQLACYISEVEAQYEEKLKLLDEPLASEFLEQCKEAARIGGGGGSVSPLGCWTIPPIIINEGEFRRRIVSSP